MKRSTPPRPVLACCMRSARVCVTRAAALVFQGASAGPGFCVGGHPPGLPGSPSRRLRRRRPSAEHPHTQARCGRALRAAGHRRGIHGVARNASGYTLGRLRQRPRWDRRADREPTSSPQVEKVLDDLFAKFTGVSAGRPLPNTFITPQIEVGAMTHLVLALARNARGAQRPAGASGSGWRICCLSRRSGLDQKRRSRRD
jgi:hypothetical protein